MDSPRQPEVWFITGTSSGLGECLVQSVLAREDYFIATVRQVEKFKLTDVDRTRLHVLRLDVTDFEENISKAVSEGVAKWGRIDVLVNNAGIIPKCLSEEGGSKAAMETFQTNFFGQINVTNAVLPYMRERKSGTIVNMGSRSAWIDLPNFVWYCSSKAALHAYTTTLANEMAGFGIRAMVAIPGGFQTPTTINGPSLAKKAIPDYDEMRQNAHRIAQQSWDQWKGVGDPARAMELLVDVLKGEGRAKGRDAPVLLFVGQGTYNRGRAYCKNLMETMDAWEDIARDLDLEESS
ncbi:uncharacterized protein B0H18DRAFT_1117616 [Fomitopsis serialis]|uniref:uncharacterized protein n=1 Tax=Fomitopsis serialis TaxID=139415 RepID=UPI0020083A5F|nr:uncharacterized protein B0H18DRAFT_1117616 [Neoantrodia serialis]KAH9929275.1 hypothetical protein B0H18DRAFT_1117616 [Neoantrodia serialis]